MESKPGEVVYENNMTFQPDVVEASFGPVPTKDGQVETMAQLPLVKELVPIENTLNNGGTEKSAKENI